MNTDLNMKVNVLPVYTYNFLKVNDSNIELSDISIDTVESPAAAELPQGVSVKRGISFDEAGEVFRANKDRILVTTGVPGDPNGDTSARDSEQAVRTGMGIDADKLFISAGAKSEVYTVEENAKVEKPVVIRFDMKDGKGVLASQVIHAKKNSEVTIIMDYDSGADKEAAGFLGVSTRILAEEGAKVTVVKTQLLGSRYLHFDDLGGACFEKGAIRLVSLELGAQKVWNGSYINLAEKEADFTSDTGYLCRGEDKLDINFVTDHRGKKTNALMQFKGVLMDKAQKTLRFTIDFKNGSSGSAGDEQEDALLLSEDVINRSMPIILCQEEDVDGRHGATIGQLGEDLLFYMQSRGIDEEEAKRIMIKARLDSVARIIPDPELMQRVQYYIQNII
ncbi:SufB/SufD family protein [Butyrivibrio sp. VCB2006]|uniref:SufB/SufD family protein n=1 Tax=Butyrivibrio sp. VCB2006 TaxID=1280679 RepID=UPI000414E866|nr:SufD family Fe-S cluster assembly protein [Butyrivibrio sp. VCB2006]